MSDNTSSNIGSDIYSGTAEFGKISVTIGAVVGTIFCSLFILVGLYLIFFQKNKYTVDVTGTVALAACNNIQNNSTQDVQCNLTVTYTVNGQLYTQTLQVNSTYTQGQQIKLSINPNDPTDITLMSTVPLKTVGGFMVGISLIILIAIWVNYHFTQKYKAYAAVEGVGAGINMLRHI